MTNTTACSSLCIASVGCPSCTCPDCGVVGLGYVCGSPDDPTGGLDCYRRTLDTGWALSVYVKGEAEPGRCTTILDDGTFVVDFAPEVGVGWSQHVTMADLVEAEPVR